MDINKPAEDAADRMQTMCCKLSINRSIIRARGWPLVASELVEGEERTRLPKVLRNADFAEGFLCLLKTSTPRDLNTTPKLDEKAWGHYSRQLDKYDGVNQALDKLFAPDVDVREQDIALRALRRALIPLYHDVLRRADFTATTPVAAPRLSDIFYPELVIFDECAHARELSTIITLAYFNPKAWFFVSEHRQTDSYVDAKFLPYESQLRM